MNSPPANKKRKQETPSADKDKLVMESSENRLLNHNLNVLNI